MVGAMVGSTVGVKRQDAPNGTRGDLVSGASAGRRALAFGGGSFGSKGAFGAGGDSRSVRVTSDFGG